MKLPFFNFYINDWLTSRKILLMTDAQKGIYITLLCHQWAEPSCSIPAEKKILQKLLPGSKWKNIEVVIKTCFVQCGADGDRARNERLYVEQSKAINKSETNRQSAEKRWSSAEEQPRNSRGTAEEQPRIGTQKETTQETKPLELQEKQDASAMPTQCEGNAIQIQTHIQTESNNARSAFKAPTVDEVSAYCNEKGSPIDPEAFHSFYESKGWMIGKNKMKSWTAAIRTWERNHKGKPLKAESSSWRDGR